MPDIDYGPLQQLISTWRGRGGLDIAPEPDGTERNPYFDRLLDLGQGRRPRHALVRDTACRGSDSRWPIR